MRRIIAAVAAALLGLVALAGCSMMSALDSPEAIAKKIKCTDLHKEPSIIGEADVCTLNGKSVGIMEHSQKLEDAYAAMLTMSQGGYAKVNKWLISSNDTATAALAFERLGVEGFLKESASAATDEGKPRPEDLGEPTGEPTGPVEGEPDPESSESPYEEEEASEAEFGETITFADGVSITVTDIRYEKLSEYGYGAAEGDNVVVFTIKVVNGSDKSLKDYYLSASASFGAEGEEAEIVSDTGIKESISGMTIRKGKTKVGEYAYAIPKKQTGDVQLEISGAFVHSSVLFYGAAKETK